MIVMGAPFWGNDFGGAVAAAPGFALLGVVAARSPSCGGARCGCSSACSSPPGSSSARSTCCARPTSARHVGKFFEKAGTDFGGATLVLRRKASENLSTLGHSLLLFCLVALAVLVAYLWWVRPRSLRALFARVSTARVTAIALGIVAVLGFALNDSGITIPSMMAAVAEATVVILLARVVFAGRQPERRSPRPARAAVEHELEPSVIRAGERPVTVVVAFLVGLVTVRFLRMVSGEILASPALERTNYRGHRLATAGGLFIILTVLVIDAGRSVLGAIGVGSESRPHPGAPGGAVRGVRLRVPRHDRRPRRGGGGPRVQGPPRRAARGSRHHRPAQAARRRGGGDRDRRHPRLQVGAHAASSTPRSSRWPPTSATSSTARRVARSSSGSSPTCRSPSPSAPRPSASPPRR